ncbi:FtsX-like permease family protein [compost metagenome]
MTVVPHHLYHTISSKEFISYMGIGKSDLRIDVTQGQDASRGVAELGQALEHDPEVAKYVIFHTKVFEVKPNHGAATEELIKIELGNHLVFPLNYATGKAPVQDNEIALSVLQAQELKVSVGDTLSLQIQDQDRAFNVSGIYSDITNGGKTAKAMFSDDSVQPVWSVIYAELQNQVSVSEKVEEYTAQFEFAKVTGIDEYKTGTFGSTIASARLASYVAMGIALMLTILVTLLFIKMLVIKDRYSIAVMKAIGFKKDDVMVQYLTRSIFVAVCAVIIGIFLANYIGAWMVGGILSSFGTSAFQFEIQPMATYVIQPLFIIVAVLIATMTGASSINKIKIYDNMKE